MYVPCPWRPEEDRKRSPELELHMIGSCLVGAGNWTCDLQKSSTLICWAVSPAPNFSIVFYNSKNVQFFLNDVSCYQNTPGRKFNWNKLIWPIDFVLLWRRDFGMFYLWYTLKQWLATGSVQTANSSQLFVGWGFIIETWVSRRNLLQRFCGPFCAESRTAPASRVISHRTLL